MLRSLVGSEMCIRDSSCSEDFLGGIGSTEFPRALALEFSTPSARNAGADLPTPAWPSGPGNLRLSAFWILTRINATHAGILTSQRSTRPYRRASPPWERSPTSQTDCVRSEPRLRWWTLAPLHLRRGAPRLVSCYALFKGWLLLSQPPGCHGSSTSFPT